MIPLRKCSVLDEVLAICMLPHYHPCLQRGATVLPHLCIPYNLVVPSTWSTCLPFSTWPFCSSEESLQDALGRMRPGAIHMQPWLLPLPRPLPQSMLPDKAPQPARSKEESKPHNKSLMDTDLELVFWTPRPGFSSCLEKSVRYC